MPTPSIQTLTTDAQQVLNLDSISAVRSVVAVALANANTGTPLNPNLTTQQLWDQFYQVVTRPKSDIESIIANQLMKFLYSPPAPGGAGADKQVIFNDGGVLAGAANLYWDKVNNRVGIGTATPVNTLEVVAPAGDNIVSTFRSGDATAANNAGGGFRSISSATAANRVAQVWLDADGANFSGGDYFFIQKNGGSGTVEFNQSSNAAMVFLTNSTERMRIDSSGNVGIGVTPSAWATTFNVKAFQTAGGSLFNFSNTVISLTQNSFYNTSGGYSYANNGFASEYYQMDGKHIWRTAASGTAGNAITFTQAMTLDASGNLLLAKTAVSQTTLGFMAEAAGTVTSTLASSTTGSTFNVYSTGAAAYRFYVGMNGTISATNTTISAISDARLKENVQDIDVGLGAILALKPRKFDWKAGKGKDIKGDRGFIAQEFEQVFPQLVDEWKDQAPEGEAPYKSVRQDLIPVLVKAIQELAARVQTLETR